MTTETPAAKKLGQAAYDRYRDSKHKSRRPVGQIGSAERKELGLPAKGGVEGSAL